MEIRKIKRVAAVLIILLNSIMSYGQMYQFFPCVDLSESVPQIKVYNEDLEKIFISNFKQEFIVRFIAKPSFDPEYAFQIYQVDDSAFIIEAFEMKANLWYTRRTDSINYYCRDIDTKLLQKIESLFKILINSAQNKSPFMAGLDGVNYNFLYNTNDVIKCAETDYIDNNSIIDEIIQLTDTLMLYAKDKDSNASPIEERIKSLCIRIECY